MTRRVTSGDVVQIPELVRFKTNLNKYINQSVSISLFQVCCFTSEVQLACGSLPVFSCKKSGFCYSQLTSRLTYYFLYCQEVQLSPGTSCSAWGCCSVVLWLRLHWRRSADTGYRNNLRLVERTLFLQEKKSNELTVNTSLLLL